MFVYSQQDIEKAQKPITDHNSDYYITKEDAFYMLTSCIAFIVILMLTL